MNLALFYWLTAALIIAPRLDATEAKWSALVFIVLGAVFFFLEQVKK